MEREYVKGRVSVIIPVYNAEKFISEALDSVFAQTYKDIEIVLVDDRSRDNSADIIKEYMKNNQNIIYYLQPTNQGAGAARNKALELATGEYVAFLDSDDIWMPTKIKKQINLMSETNTPFSYAAIEMIDEAGKLLKSKRNIKETCDYKYLLHNTIIATSSVVINRNIVGDFRMPTRRGGQDYATWLMLLRDGIVAYGINEELVKYRISDNSLSSNKLDSVCQIWEIQRMQEELPYYFICLNIVKFIIHSIKKYYF